MCGATCARAELHAGAECRVMASAGVRARVEDMDSLDNQYSAVSVLR